ncbi:hypothetical protein DFA_05105 [Cavenderia fasciculata]|uniref:Uncharacterized protein n=1 Tax=Cavenderia fasciculata TaxID=261658 RepID=F4PNC2_CACFS|nr:uncharacterized protein DFA_05105 [Cavenderia fasciculata]EGG22975.1 hypothetical protein DFA_05105 [Cavenderia fasciculata]|eukprot:XP_004360826.1 hypothetical protein DFA_05105 [Cavenderia fasciculata]
MSPRSRCRDIMYNFSILNGPIKFLDFLQEYIKMIFLDAYNDGYFV